MAYVVYQNGFISFNGKSIDFIFKPGPYIPDTYQVVDVASFIPWNDTSKGAAFLFKPKYDFECTTIGTYCGRDKTTSTSNPSDHIDLLKVYEYDNGEINEYAAKTLCNYSTASLYGALNSTEAQAKNLQWFSGTASASVPDGKHSCYGEITNIMSSDGVDPLRHYIIKKTDGSKFSFIGGKCYMIGYICAFYNGDNGQHLISTLCIDRAGDDYNCIMAHSHGSNRILEKHTSYLPYFEVDGQLYKDFDLTE